MNSNVDHEEVNKFAALAARWWDRDSEFKPLHDINPLRLNYIKEQCGGISKVSAYLMLAVVVEY